MQSSRRARARAWLYLICLSLRRQARARQMVWISLGLLGVMATMVAFVTAAGRWGPDFWTAFSHFSRGPVFEGLLGFLLPIWSLSFAIQALGSERETRNLVWLLTRPLSRPAIYLAKFIALVPWSLGLNIGGFGLLCLIAGPPGHLAFRLYWPAFALGTIAYCSLFHLVGAYFRRPAVVGIMYSFFLETFLGSMPGQMKRISISFYTRCLTYEVAGEYGLPPPVKPSIYLPVDGTTAWCVLLGVSVFFLVFGMAVFSRLEYDEQT